MTDKQIKMAYKTIPSIKDYANWTPEQRTLNMELSCRDMINSALCYGGIKGFWAKHHDIFGHETSYADKYIAELGEDRVREIASEQEADFARATVHYSVVTDCEGNSYNSIVWADD